MKGIIFFIGFLIIISYASPMPEPRPDPEREYPLRLQPELDAIDINSYLRNERLLKLQVDCLLRDGACDPIGRWSKPRVKAGLLGECLMCTEVQKSWLNQWLSVLIEKYPELYRAAIAKYLHGTGIKISDEEIKRLSSTLEDKFIDSAISNSTMNADSMPSSPKSLITSSSTAAASEEHQE